MISSDQVVLFQGDSITDAGRTGGANGGLGCGFPFIIDDYFKTEKPEMNVTVINKGISGDRSKDLVARWTEDCVALRPDQVTILIGVNDTWRGFDSDDPTTAEQFEANLREIVGRTVKETDAKILLLMPYIVLGSTDWADKMLPDLEGKRAAVKKIAEEFGTELFDLQKLFDDAIAAGTAPSALSADGVHPTEDCGHKVIAEAWIKKEVG